MAMVWDIAQCFTAGEQASIFEKTYQVEKLIKKLIFVVIAYFNITIFKNGYKTTVFCRKCSKTTKKFKKS